MLLLKCVTTTLQKYIKITELKRTKIPLGWIFRKVAVQFTTQTIQLIQEVDKWYLSGWMFCVICGEIH